MSTEITAEDVCKMGRAIWGDQWQKPAADSLLVNDRTIQRIANGTTPVPAWMYEELRKQARLKIQQMQDLFNL